MRVTNDYNLARVLAEWETGKAFLTPEQRIEQMYYCHRLRNFIFNVNLQGIDGTLGATSRFQGIANGQAPQFANDLVVTNMVWSDQLYHQVFGSTPFLGARVNVIGTPGVYVEDFFGAGQFLPNEFLIDVTPDSAGHLALTDTDGSSKALEFVPRLLQKGQTLQFLMAVDMPSLFFNPLAQSICPSCVVSSVFALCQDEPYSCPSETILKMCEAHVKSQAREPFILDVRIPQADFPALRTQRVYKTEPQARPLLILGIGSNISGAQIQIRDDTKQHNFTANYQATPFTFIEGNNTIFIDPTAFQNDYCPIWGIAPSASDSQVGTSFKWLPVPHFLEPNAELVITLKNGLDWYNQPMNVGNNATAPGHIAFCCVTL